MIRRIINKVADREKGEKLCLGCDSLVDKDLDECDNCGYDFNQNRSTPEDGL